MKHTFTRREKFLMFICAVLALGIFYYEAVYKSVTDGIKRYDTAELQDELTIAQTKAAQEATMKKAISDSSSTSQKGTIAVYNNLANEVNALGAILNGNAEKVSITWASPTLTDTTVRRQAAVSFKTGDYASARALIQAINDNPYRNIISNVSVTNDTNSSTTTATLTVTFFETTKGAASTEGLVTVSSDSTSTTTK
jgi:hypothetical protein